MIRYDIAIIGTGPAGISAAVTAKIRNKNILLLGSKNLSNKITRAQLIENYAGLPCISGIKLAESFKEQIKALNIEITDKTVTAVYSMGNYFAIQSGDDIFESKSVILASGVVNSRSLDGEDEFLGRGVSYCATCDARLYRDKKVAVIGYTPDSFAEAEFLTEFASQVLYFPMGDKNIQTEKSVKIISEIPKEIIGDKKVQSIKTEAGIYEVDGVFILRDAISPDKLVPGIETNGPHISVDLNMATNIPGVFACGDIAGKPYQYIKAAGQGNVAALSAVKYLNEKTEE